MKNTLFFMVLTMICLTLFTTGCTSPQQDGAITPGSTTPAESARCGFTTCNGLDLACGPDTPEVCPAIYMIGDKCRQYAYCSITGGTCMLVTTAEFDSCRNCIGRCGGADDAGMLLCE